MRNANLRFGLVWAEPAPLCNPVVKRSGE